MLNTSTPKELVLRPGLLSFLIFLPFLIYSQSLTEADILFRNGKLDSALIAYQAQPPTAYSYRRIGNIQIEFGEYRKALEFFSLAENISKSDTDLCHIEVSKGVSWDLLSDHKTARSHFNKAILLTEAPQIKFKSWANIGVSFAIEGYIDSAVFAYQKALRFNPAHPQLQSNLATAYWQLGDSLQALDQYQKAYYLADSLEDLSAKRMITLDLHNLSHQLGLSDEAYRYLIEYHRIDTMLYGQAHAEQIAELTAKWEKGLVESRLAEAEKDRYKYGLLALVAILAIVGLFFERFVKERTRRKQISFTKRVTDLSWILKDLANEHSLTARQHQVLSLYVIDNMNAASIAIELGISDKTVNDHLNGALRKIEIDRTTAHQQILAIAISRTFR